MVLVPVPSAPPTASTAQSASWALLRSHPHRGVSDDSYLRRGSHRANLQSLPPKSDHDRAMEVLRAMKPSSSAPSLTKKPTRWGSLGAGVRASATTPTAKKPQPLNLTPYELLERVDALFSTLEAAQAEADGADGGAPAEGGAQAHRNETRSTRGRPPLPMKRSTPTLPHSPTTSSGATRRPTPSSSGSAARSPRRSSAAASAPSTRRRRRRRRRPRARAPRRSGRQRVLIEMNVSDLLFAHGESLGEKELVIEGLALARGGGRRHVGGRRRRRRAEGDRTLTRRSRRGAARSRSPSTASCARAAARARCTRRSRRTC